MDPTEPPVVEAMHTRVQAWEAAADARAVFLRCYLMMTRNMLAAVRAGEFRDPAWVTRLLERFAEYYFEALAAYERDPATTPEVWRRAHHATAHPEVTRVQKLILGVNAHINYDLVFTLVELLRPEWPALSPAARADRYADHCQVNRVIGRTIDAVQDQVLEPASPVLALLDEVLGRADEALISRLITAWRESVWEHAVALVEAEAPAAQADITQRVARHAVRLGALIGA